MIYRYSVGFSDVDYARVLFYGRYYFIAQRASEDWQHQHGLYHRDLVPNHDLRIPIVASYCRYLGPSYVEDLLEVHVGIKDLSPRGFSYVFAFFRQGEERCLAWGYTERRFVTADGRAREAPDAVASALGSMAAESSDFVDQVWELLAKRQRSREA